MIFASYIILHTALCMTLPKPLAFMSLSAFSAVALTAMQAVRNAYSSADIKAATLRFSWIFLVHYIPIISRGKIRIAKWQFMGFLVVTGLYLGWNYIGLPRRFGATEININNALMHCGLIINNLIAHYIVQGALF